ncbi:hypothetical protein [Burkholderia dolosa]|nr:hypothetical protein [Burkholderia dolosa]
MTRIEFGIGAEIFFISFRAKLLSGFALFRSRPEFRPITLTRQGDSGFSA